MTMLNVSCINCGRAYPPNGLPYRCTTCGGLYDLSEPLKFDPTKVDCSQPGIWCYRNSFGIFDEQTISLGEGRTPLIWAEVFGRQVAFKCEYLNPTGSFKDRGTTTMISILKIRGVTEAVEDSSGNAGASFAAYAARAGIKASIFVPESASGPKRQQIAAYGAKVVPVHGSRSQAAEAVRNVGDAGIPYASHAYLPFNIPGYATLAYELYEIFNSAPAAIILPAGQGGLLLGIGRGFQALMQGGLVHNIPKLIAVQASACAPLSALATLGPVSLNRIGETPTLAEGVRVRYPLRGDAVVQMVKQSDGQFVSVDEAYILLGRDQLAQRGFYVEPTSALVWHALKEALVDLDDPVVVILTGSGYKYVDNQSNG